MAIPVPPRSLSLTLPASLPLPLPVSAHVSMLLIICGYVRSILHGRLMLLIIITSIMTGFLWRHRTSAAPAAGNEISLSLRQRGGRKEEKRGKRPQFIAGCYHHRHHCVHQAEAGSLFWLQWLLQWVKCAATSVSALGGHCCCCCCCCFIEFHFNVVFIVRTCTWAWVSRPRFACKLTFMTTSEIQFLCLIPK